MSDEQFTKADWRPGKRRKTYPRVKPWGGQKEAPPAFLAAGALNGFGKGKQRRCKSCNGWAMKNQDFCRMHGGARWAHKHRPYVPTSIDLGRGRR